MTCMHVQSPLEQSQKPVQKKLKEAMLSHLDRYHAVALQDHRMQVMTLSIVIRFCDLFRDPIRDLNAAAPLL